jgi:uncharacterized protein (TIGR03000 family)
MIAAGSTTPAWHHHHARHSYRSCNAYSCYSSCSCYGRYVGCCCGYTGCYGCYSSYGYGYNGGGCCYYSAPVVSYGCTGCCYGGGVINSSPRIVPVPSSANSEVDMLRRQVEELRNALKQIEKVPAPKKANEEVSTRVTVTLPSTARLWVENVECPLTSSVRTFSTPPLNANQQYVYNLKVELVRDGRTVSETQRVIITPGQDARVDFNSSNVVGTASR